MKNTFIYDQAEARELIECALAVVEEIEARIHHIPNEDEKEEQEERLSAAVEAISRCSYKLTRAEFSIILHPDDLCKIDNLFFEAQMCGLFVPDNFNQVYDRIMNVVDAYKQSHRYDVLLSEEQRTSYIIPNNIIIFSDAELMMVFECVEKALDTIRLSFSQRSDVTIHEVDQYVALTTGFIEKYVERVYQDRMVLIIEAEDVWFLVDLLHEAWGPNCKVPDEFAYIVVRVLNTATALCESSLN